MRPSKDTYDELRLAIQDLRWATAHLTNYYNKVKPADAPKIEDDPRQLKIDFGE